MLAAVGGYCHGVANEKGACMTETVPLVLADGSHSSSGGLLLILLVLALAWALTR